MALIRKFRQKRHQVRSSVARGERASESMRLGVQTLEVHQQIFGRRLKTRFKQKFRPKNA